MEIDPLDELLSSVLQMLAQDVPDEARALAEFKRLERLSTEVDEKGNPTKAAHRAKTRLGNPFLVEETTKSSRAKAEKQERASHEKYMKALSETIKSWAVNRQYKRKIAVLDAHEERLKPLERTREKHDPESVFALGYPLLETLTEEGVSPSSIGRLPVFARIFIADLIKAHARDPKLENPQNVWNQIVRSGVLSAYRERLDKDESNVIAYAASCRDGEANEWAAKARVELDLPVGFSGNFLEGAAMLADASRELTSGEAAAYNHAFGLKVSRDVELLAKVLKLDSNHEVPLLTSMVHFLTQTQRLQYEDLRFTIQLVATKQSIDSIKPAHKLKSDWVAELIELLPDLAARLSDSVDSVAAFEMLVMGGLRCSDAAIDFKNRKEEKERDQRAKKLAEDVREACDEGTTFKIFDGRVFWMEDIIEFSEIEAEEWTNERWLEVYGALPDRMFNDALSASFRIECSDPIDPSEQDGSNHHDLVQDVAESDRMTDYPHAITDGDCVGEPSIWQKKTPDTFENSEPYDDGTIALESASETPSLPAPREDARYDVGVTGNDENREAEPRPTTSNDRAVAAKSSQDLTKNSVETDLDLPSVAGGSRAAAATEIFDQAMPRKDLVMRYERTLLDDLDDEELR